MPFPSTERSETTRKGSVHASPAHCLCPLLVRERHHATPSKTGRDRGVTTQLATQSCEFDSRLSARLSRSMPGWVASRTCLPAFRKKLRKPGRVSPGATSAPGSMSVTAVRSKVEQNQLVDVFGEIGFGVDGLIRQSRDSLASASVERATLLPKPMWYSLRPTALRQVSMSRRLSRCVSWAKAIARY